MLTPLTLRNLPLLIKLQRQDTLMADIRQVFYQVWTTYEVLEPPHTQVAKISVRLPYKTKDYADFEYMSHRYFIPMCKQIEAFLNID